MYASRLPVTASLVLAFAFCASSAIAQPPPAPPAQHVPTPTTPPPAHAPTHAPGAAASPPKPLVLHATAPVAPAAKAETLPPAIRLTQGRMTPPPSKGLFHDGFNMTAWGDARKLPVHSEEKRLWRIANRDNPGFSKSGRDRFSGTETGDDAAQARHINCVYASLALEDTLSGHPAVALPGWAKAHVPQDLVQARQQTLGKDFASRYTGDANESVLYADQYPGVTFERTNDYHDLESRLAKSGDGSRMILVGTWDHLDNHGKVEATGGHAFNMVNMKGTVVVVDGQSGEISKPSVYFGEERWHDFHFHVTAEGAPGKSPIVDDAP